MSTPPRRDADHYRRRRDRGGVDDGSPGCAARGSGPASGAVSPRQGTRARPDPAGSDVVATVASHTASDPAPNVCLCPAPGSYPMADFRRGDLVRIQAVHSILCPLETADLDVRAWRETARYRGLYERHEEVPRHGTTVSVKARQP